MFRLLQSLIFCMFFQLPLFAAQIYSYNTGTNRGYFLSAMDDAPIFSEFDRGEFSKWSFEESGSFMRFRHEGLSQNGVNAYLATSEEGDIFIEFLNEGDEVADDVSIDFELENAGDFTYIKATNGPLDNSYLFEENLDLVMGARPLEGTWLLFGDSDNDD